MILNTRVLWGGTRDVAKFWICFLFTWTSLRGRPQWRHTNFEQFWTPTSPSSHFSLIRPWCCRYKIIESPPHRGPPDLDVIYELLLWKKHKISDSERTFLDIASPRWETISPSVFCLTVVLGLGPGLSPQMSGMMLLLLLLLYSSGCFCWCWNFKVSLNSCSFW